MKKVLVFALLIGAGSFLFGQDGGMELGLGFQYGRAQVFGKNVTMREITEPGILLTLRLAPGPIGFFARLGALFPSEVTEGGLTLTYDEYDYILFLNGALGPSFSVPLGSFAFIFDVGLSINDLLYGGSYRDTINARWSIKLENLGTTFKGGHTYENIRMSEVYNDVAIGIFGNAVLRFSFTPSVYLELAGAASFDFLRFINYSFSADLTGNSAWPDQAKNDFPADKLDNPNNPTKLILESDSAFKIFKQFTFVPSISVGFRL
jgi:hypothetical protein